MNGCIVATALLLFISVWLLHVVIWRLYRVKKEILTLFFLFWVIPLLALIAAMPIASYEGFSVVAIGTLYFSLSLAYLQTYPALKSGVPTFRILLLIHQRGQEGLQESQVSEAFRNDEEFVPAKISELQEDSLVVVRKDGRLKLSFMGKILASLFLYYRRLLGLKWGQG